MRRVILALALVGSLTAQPTTVMDPIPFANLSAESSAVTF